MSQLAEGLDEIVYRAQAETIRKHGFPGFRKLADKFIATKEIAAYPSPLRWLWICQIAALPVRVVQLVSLFALALLALWALEPPLWVSVLLGTSPLAFTLSRRTLQDVFVAALMMLGIGCAVHGFEIGVAVSVFLMLSAKEGAVFALPMLAVFGARWGLVAGGAAWLAGLALIFGPARVRAMFRILPSGHRTQYTEEQQRGAPHRLLVDFFLVSPAACIAAVLGASRAPTIALAFGVLVGMHALAPVRNVRLVLAGDLLLRGLAVRVIPVWALPAMVMIDEFIAWKIRKVYDPVTSALTSELC